MNFIKDAILEASNATGCTVTQLNDDEASLIRERIEEKYAATRGPSPLWERLEMDVSKYDPDGWRAIGDFPLSDMVTMFFDRENETTMYSVKSCSDVVELLSECPGFVFYITDVNCSFLLCHNDHDYLIGTGEARDWVSGR